MIMGEIVGLKHINLILWQIQGEKHIIWIKVQDKEMLPPWEDS